MKKALVMNEADKSIWKQFCKLTLPPLSLCPTKDPQASSAIKPAEVTLAGLVTVSNEMYSCCVIHKAGTGLLDGPKTPLGSFSSTCAYRQGNKRDKAGRRRAPLSSRLFIQDPIYQSPVGWVEWRSAKTKCRKGRSDVYTDTEQDGSFILAEAPQRARHCVTLKFKQLRHQYVFGSSCVNCAATGQLNLFLHNVADGHISLCRALTHKLLCYFPKQNYVTDIMLCNSHAHRKTISRLDAHPTTHTCARVHASTHTGTHTPCFASGLLSPSCEDSLCRW